MYIIMCMYEGKQLCLENLTQFYVTPKGSETQQHGGGKLHFKLFLTRKIPLVSTEILTLCSKNKDASGIACTLKLNHTNISSAKNLLPPPPSVHLQNWVYMFYSRRWHSINLWAMTSLFLITHTHFVHGCMMSGRHWRWHDMEREIKNQIPWYCYSTNWTKNLFNILKPTGNSFPLFNA